MPGFLSKGLIDCFELHERCLAVTCRSRFQHNTLLSLDFQKTVYSRKIGGDWRIVINPGAVPFHFAIAFAVALGKVDLGGLDVEEGNRLAKRALELVDDGTVGYTLITAVRT